MAAPDAGPIVERDGAPLPGLVPPHEREASIPLTSDTGKQPRHGSRHRGRGPGLAASGRGPGAPSDPAIPPSPAPAIRFTP